MKDICLDNTILSQGLVKRLNRLNITHLSHLVKLDEDGLMKLGVKTHIKRKEINEIKEYLFIHYPNRFSDDFRFLPELKERKG